MPELGMQTLANSIVLAEIVERVQATKAKIEGFGVS